MSNLSCDKSKTVTVLRAQVAIPDSITDKNVIDDIKRDAIQDSLLFVVDDYPVTNEMLAHSSNKNLIIKIGDTFSNDRIWFGNKSIKQTLVFELYADYHRMMTYHFYSENVPSELIKEMAFWVKSGDYASDEQIIKDFPGFIEQAKDIKSVYFRSKKGFKLGDLKQNAINIYGQSYKNHESDGIEVLEWDFIGDEAIDTKADIKGKRIAKDSFGHHIVMYFKEGKLVGQILINDIP
jgi:hypothetical protein